MRIDGIAFRFGHLAAVLEDHALSQQPGERLIRFDQTFIAHQLVKETRIQQMQNRVLDTADVLVYGQPVVSTLIEHGFGTRAGKTCVIPGRLEEGVESVGLALGLATAFRADRLVEFGHMLQRGTEALAEINIFGQYHWQLFLRNWDRAAAFTVDNRYRRAPVALA